MPWRPLHALPLHVVNGTGVALGVCLIQALVSALAGTQPALWAVSGAVCVSLADLPVVPRRSWRRVSLAALSTCVVTALVVALRAHPVALGGVVTLVAFASAMTLAWGLRAGPVSFVGILAIVFAMAVPPVSGWAAVFSHTAWTALGAALYVAWAMFSSVMLQRRYRALALAGALDGVSALLRARVALLVPPPPQVPHRRKVWGRRAPARGSDPAAERLRAWIRDETALNDRVQAARDLIFERPDRDAETRRLAGLLMLAIDLRDTLLASELDLGLLGDDALATSVRQRLAANLEAQAGALDEMQGALRYDDSVASTHDSDDRPLHAWVAGLALLAGDLRERLLPALADRAQHMVDDLRQMRALMRGELMPLRLTRGELSLFVSVEGWPLAALKPHTSGRSPVLRHAARSAVALGAAYFIGEALPWASHPHWLVLSVAVVLRGNLEQTLARRNARLGGTVLGCLLVLGLAQLHWGGVAAVVFLVAVGTAHAFVNVRYLVTAVAATVMALLQAHLADPAAGFAVTERLADTALGAVLAWAFCYVLPSWERSSLARALDRLLNSLNVLAGEVLAWPEPGRSRTKLGLARREAYESLAALAAVAQRSSVEPERVRVPLQAITDVLTYGQEMLGHLAAMRQMLTRRVDELDRGPAEAVLRRAADAVGHCLARASASDSGERAIDTPPDAGPLDLPSRSALVALLPWFERRSQMTVRAARGVADAVRVLRAHTRERRAAV
ncbi:FUSC family protein [Methylibium sp.]|uniref:FUSC family protein n=1 Tax=Methylibium sp. TaxID=2067992 RepID=UPI003D0EDFCC